MVRNHPDRQEVEQEPPEHEEPQPPLPPNSIREVTAKPM